MNIKLILIFVFLFFGVTSCSDNTEDQHNDTPLTVIHTVSYSNASIFSLLANDKNNLKRRFISDPGQHVDALIGAGNNYPVVSVTPFSNALIAISRNPELVIIAGSGLNGLSLVSSINGNLASLEGKKIGTARGDSLELFVVEAMKTLKFTPVYFTDPFVLVESAKAGEIEAVTHVEPFASNLINDSGFSRVITSKELWGDHPDAVILTTRTILSKFENDLADFIKDVIKSEKKIEENYIAAANELAVFYEMPPEVLVLILDLQEPQTDIREYEPFFEQRIDTLVQLGYIDEGNRPTNYLDWRFFQD